MSRFFQILIALCVLFAASTIQAQTIALGERTPRVKQAKWLDGKVPPKNKFTYIEFIHSASQPCRLSAERIFKIVNEFDNISFVLISHQKLTEIDAWVLNFVGERSGVIIEDSSIRQSFGVNYAPYGVVLDHKRRALWFGNPQFLTRDAIEKLTESGTDAKPRAEAVYRLCRGAKEEKPAKQD